MKKESLIRKKNLVFGLLMLIAALSYSQNRSLSTLPQKIVFNGITAVAIDTQQSNLVIEMWSDIKAYRQDKAQSDSIISAQNKTIHHLKNGVVLRDSLCQKWEIRYNDKRNKLTIERGKNKILKVILVPVLMLVAVETIVLMAR